MPCHWVLGEIEFVELQNVVTANDAQHFFIRNLSTSSGVRSLRRPCPSRLRYCGITCASAKVCRTVIVDLTCTDISPDRAEKNSADTSSEHPIISWISQLPMISDHRFFEYRFCNWPKLCTASITRISLDLTTESDRQSRNRPRHRRCVPRC